MKIVRNIGTSCYNAAKKRESEPSYPLQCGELMSEILVAKGGLVTNREDFQQTIFKPLATNPSSPFHEDCLLYPLLIALEVDNIPPQHQLFDTVDAYNRKIDKARNDTLEGASVQDIGEEQARIVGFVKADVGKMTITNDYLRSVLKDNRGGGALRVIEEKIEENGGVGCRCPDCEDMSPEEVASFAHLLTLSHHLHARSSVEHMQKYGNSTNPSALGYEKLRLQKDDMELACSESHYDDDLGILAKLGCAALAGTPRNRTRTNKDHYSNTVLTRWHRTNQYNTRTNGGISVIGDMPITLPTAHRVAEHHPTRTKTLKIVGLAGGGEIILDTGKSFNIGDIIKGNRQKEAVVGEVADARNRNPSLFMDKSIQEKPCVVPSSHTAHNLHHRLEQHSAVLDDKLGIERRYTVTSEHYVMNLQDMPRVQALIEKHGGIDNIPRLPPKIMYTEEDVEYEKKWKGKQREVIKLKRSSVTDYDGYPVVKGEDFAALVNHEAKLIIEPGSYDSDEAYAEKLAILKGEGPEESEHYVKLTKSLFVPRAVNESPSTDGGDKLVADESLSAEDDSPDARDSVGPAKEVSETPANHKEDTNKKSPDDIAKPSSAAVSVGKAQFSGLQGTDDNELPSPPKSKKPTSTMASFDHGEDSDSSVTLPSNPAGNSASKKRKATIFDDSDLED